MADLVISPATGPLVGSVPVPGDGAIAARALLLAALGSGRSTLGVHGGLGEDGRIIEGALRALGVGVTEPEPGCFTVQGVGLSGLAAPAYPLDCGRSSEAMHLLAGVLVAQRFDSILQGDASLRMDRVTAALRLRGARIEGKLHPDRVGAVTPPLQITGLPEPIVLDGAEHDAEVLDPDTKGALLLSGLYAAGATYVREPFVSGDHLERLLSALGVPFRAAGAMIELDGPAFSGELPAFSVEVPGDAGVAALLVAAASIVPGSHVVARRTGSSPASAGWIEIARDMRAELAIEPRGEVLGEPVGDVHARAAALEAVRTGGERVARSLEALPGLVVLAARARGTTALLDVPDVRGASARLGALAEVLEAFGLRWAKAARGLEIEGRSRGPLRAADVRSGGDADVAMAAAVLGLAADGPTTVRDAGCIGLRFPRFVGTLRALGAEVVVVDGAGEDRP